MKKFYFLTLLVASSLLYAENWTGTGWALKEGYIVTNFHCVDGAKSIVVETTEDHYTAKVVATDPSSDLAIIQINDDKFHGFGQIPYSIERKQCEVGETVWTLGYPMTSIMGDEVKFTDGKVSSKTGYKGDLSTYQITVPIQPGNSGGPLINQHGKIVGITSSGLDKSLADNVNYAIKTSYLLNLIESTISLSILPTGSTTNLSLTDQIKMVKKYIFPLYFSNDNANSVSNTANMHNGYEYVDLGLSVKWATCNIGALSPEEYGDYYAWGETTTKPYYTWDSYKYYLRTYSFYEKPFPYSDYQYEVTVHTQSKYCVDGLYGTVDNKKQLDLSDDAANVKWGGLWRIPTLVELQELVKKCKWEWTDYNGISGYKVIGPNGRSIFLPAAGRQGSTTLDAKSGYYASCSLSLGTTIRYRGDYAYGIYLYEDNTSNKNYYSVCSIERKDGISIRPVCP